MFESEPDNPNRILGGENLRFDRVVKPSDGRGPQPKVMTIFMKFLTFSETFILIGGTYLYCKPSVTPENFPTSDSGGGSKLTFYSGKTKVKNSRKPLRIEYAKHFHGFKTRLSVRRLSR